MRSVSAIIDDVDKSKRCLFAKVGCAHLSAETDDVDSSGAVDFGRFSMSRIDSCLLAFGARMGMADLSAKGMVDFGLVKVVGINSASLALGTVDWSEIDEIESDIVEFDIFESGGVEKDSVDSEADTADSSEMGTVDFSTFFRWRRVFSCRVKLLWL